MKIAIIYHKSDYDGILSNEVCRYWLNELLLKPEIHSYGWNYGEPIPVPHGAADGVDDFAGYDQIYIVDLSIDELMSRPDLRHKIVWIDHHKSAIEKWDIPDLNESLGITQQFIFKGYRIDGVAACRLCWQWFLTRHINDCEGPGSTLQLPSKQDFVDRILEEPTLIRLAGEYDVWDHRDPDAATLQLGLRAMNPLGFSDLVWQEFSESGDWHLHEALKKGRVIQSYVDQDAETRMQAAYITEWEGLRFLCLNGRGNSLTFRSRIDELKPDALLMWYYDGSKSIVSLYHATGREDIDLSVIAKKHGGGGHRGACGFTIKDPCLQVRHDGPLPY